MLFPTWQRTAWDHTVVSINMADPGKSSKCRRYTYLPELIRTTSSVRRTWSAKLLSNQELTLRPIGGGKGCRKIGFHLCGLNRMKNEACLSTAITNQWVQTHLITACCTGLRSRFGDLVGKSLQLVKGKAKPQVRRGKPKRRAIGEERWQEDEHKKAIPDTN